MKIDSEQFNQYMLAKGALNKMYVCATIGADQPYAKVTLTRDECFALFSQKVIDLDAHKGMLE